MILKKYCLWFLLLLNLGCDSNLLDTIPDDRVSSDIFWKQDKDALSTCNALYTFLDGIEKLHRDVFTDIAHTNTEFGDYKAIEVGAYNALNPVVESEWTKDYKGIRGTNYFLENVGKIQAENKDLINQLTGEVRFIRAYLYIHLVFIYGNIPLITKTISIDEGRSIGQVSSGQVWDFIEKELTEAASQLPIEPSEPGRITKGAALALLARAMLYAKRYTKAAEAAQAVMDLSVYSLYPSYEKLFSYSAENNSGVILDKEFVRNVYSNDVAALFAPFAILSNGVTLVPLKKIVDSYQMNNGKDITDQGGGFDPYHPYKDRDPRLLYSIYVPGSILPNGEVFDSRPDSGKPDAWGSNYQVSRTGFYVKKYINEEDLSELSNCGINIILIRYAEVLLTYAEAKTELNQIDQSVFDAINKIRQRPDVNMPPIIPPKSQDELRKIIRHERMVEFAFEGQRFFDIRRWGIAEQVFNKPILGMTYVNDNGKLVTVAQPSFVRSFKEKDYLWPIPQKELELNKNLKQNPGW